MKSQKQQAFEILSQKNIKFFGGEHLKNSNAKVKRPISLKRPMHLVMRSSKARGSQSFLRQSKKIFSIISKQAQKSGVKVYRFANAGNHLHLVVLPRSRAAFNSFVRSISGLIARVVLGVERGCAKGVQFWDKRPFTRIIEWGKEYKSVCSYLMQNTLEALGFVIYKSRVKSLKISLRTIRSTS